jgi:integrase/recombinase XerD
VTHNRKDTSMPPRPLKPLPEVGPPQTGLTALALQYYAWQSTLISEISLLHRRKSLHRFLTWCQSADITSPAGLTPQAVKLYLAVVETSLHQHTGAALSVGIKRERWHAVRQLCKWLWVHGHLAHNPAVGLRVDLREGPRVLQPVLAAHEAERVFAQWDVKTFRGLRDRALVEFLYSTGVRRKELVSLRVSDVNWTAGTAHVREGKWKRDRVVPIGDRALTWLHAYVQQCRNTFVRYDSGPLFIDLLGKELEPNAVTELVSAALKRVGLDKRGACHLFRRSMATGMLEGGADIASIQAILGHADVSTTMIYTPVTFETLAKEYHRTHPSGTGG